MEKITVVGKGKIFYELFQGRNTEVMRLQCSDGVERLWTCSRVRPDVGDVVTLRARGAYDVSAAG
jgi:hypothetical protein